MDTTIPTQKVSVDDEEVLQTHPWKIVNIYKNPEDMKSILGNRISIRLLCYDGSLLILTINTILAEKVALNDVLVLERLRADGKPPRIFQIINGKEAEELWTTLQKQFENARKMQMPSKPPEDITAFR